MINQTKLDKAAKLVNTLNKSLIVHDYLGAGYGDTVKAQKVKPSGVLMNDTKNHKVRLLVNNVLAKTISLREYEDLFNQA